MDWVNNHWEQIAFGIVVLFFIYNYILSKLKGKVSTEKIDFLKEVASTLLRKASEKDAVLKQTFENVERLKEKWKVSGLEEEFGHIGQLFKLWNEEVDMEAPVKEEYNRLIPQPEEK